MNELKEVIPFLNKDEKENLNLFNQKTLAEYLGITLRTLGRRVRTIENYCYPIKVGRRYYYYPDLIDKWMKENEKIKLDYKKIAEELLEKHVKNFRI